MEDNGRDVAPVINIGSFVYRLICRDIASIPIIPAIGWSEKRKETAKERERDIERNISLPVPYIISHLRNDLSSAMCSQLFPLPPPRLCVIRHISSFVSVKEPMMIVRCFRRATRKKPSSAELAGKSRHVRNGTCLPFGLR